MVNTRWYTVLGACVLLVVVATVGVFFWKRGIGVNGTVNSMSTTTVQNTGPISAEVQAQALKGLNTPSGQPPVSKTEQEKALNGLSTPTP